MQQIKDLNHSFEGGNWIVVLNNHDVLAVKTAILMKVVPKLLGA
jgi:hypothetical protein